VAATDTRAPSVRDAHKARTRRALREAALDLFATQGYDTTTTEEIAEKAGVSARTFFRYFKTKESVLFLGERDWLRSFAERYAEQPDEMSDVEALRTTFAALATIGLPPRRKALLQFTKAVASSPTLRGREVDHRRDDARGIAKAIATRRGLRRADEGAAILAAVALETYRRAIDTWVQGPARADIGDVVVGEFDRLAELFRRD
jgi:AcrR family transcriptional regulator